MSVEELKRNIIKKVESIQSVEQLNDILEVLNSDIDYNVPNQILSSIIADLKSYFKGKQDLFSIDQVKSELNDLKK